MDFGSGEYPVACKKIWSEAGVQSQIRKATKQLRKFQHQGIIALNIDDLLPAGRVIVDRDRAGASARLKAYIHSFKERHRSTMETAIVDQKCDGFIISATAAAVLWNEARSFNLVTEKLHWNMTGASRTSAERFTAFYAAQVL